MSTVIAVLILLDSVLLILVIMVQNSKGGGLSATFAGSNQVMGVRKTTDFLEKATWILAIALLCLSLLSAAVGSGTVDVQSSELQDFVNQQPVAPIPQGDNAPNPIRQPSGGDGQNNP